MRMLTGLTFCLLLVLLFASCQSYKKVPYLQDTDVANRTEQEVRQTGVKVMPKDLVSIVVSCSTPELAVPFNLSTANVGGQVEKKRHSGLLLLHSNIWWTIREILISLCWERFM